MAKGRVPYLLRLCLGILFLNSLLVPIRKREEWMREWRAETLYGWNRLGEVGRPAALSAWALVWRCLGGALHALWLRREDWRTHMLYQDFRNACRLLIRRPAFAVIAALTLGLGVGANSAVFGLVNAVLLRPLPFFDPDRLVVISNEYEGNRTSSSPPDYVDRREQSRTLTEVAAFDFASLNLTGEREPLRIEASRVTAGFFPLLGVEPLIGRVFRPEEDEPGLANRVVLSHEFWLTEFGGDSAITGRSILLNGRNHEVVGVMPARFQFPGRPVDVWVPIAFSDAQKSDSNRGNEYLTVIGRFESNVTLEQVDAEMKTIAARVIERVPKRSDFLRRTKWSAQVVLLNEEVVGEVRLGLLLLSAVVGFVLLIACINLAGLLLARGAARQKEMAVRTALGAGKWALARQLLAESLMLGILGGGVGVLLASLSLDALRRLDPVDLPRIQEASLDGTVLAFTVSLTIFTGILFGLVPAWQATRTDPAEAMKGSLFQGAGRQNFRSLLVVSEIAIAMVLLVGAGLTLRSFENLLRVEPGFQPDSRLTFRISLPAARYASETQTLLFFREFLRRLNHLPGVRAAGASHRLPLDALNDTSTMHVEGHAPEPGEPPPSCEYRVISPGYLRAIGMPLLLGRDFTDHDTLESAPVVLIDERTARRYWPGQSPVGRRLGFGPNDKREVIGVVGSVRNASLGVEGREQVYVPLGQDPLRSLSVVLHTAGAARDLPAGVRELLRELDRDLPVYKMQTMAERLGTSLSRPRFWTLLLALFGATGLLLASLGIYGLVSHWVSQSTREIGIRMSLGACRFSILALVFRRGIGLTAMGLAAGVLVSFGLSGLIRSLLFEVPPNDPVVLAGMAILLSLVALLACYVPARRAIRVDPMTALRTE